MQSDETAIIFIEFQNDFCKEKGKLFGLVKDEVARNKTIENAQALLTAARAKGCKIIHCPFMLDSAWVAEKAPEGILRSIESGRIFVPNTWGGQIIEELKPAENEIVLSGKRALSAFSHTNLDSLLRFADIKNVIVCGFLTNVCVQATAWSAYDRGYRVRIVSSACGAANQSIQKYVEENICPVVGGDLSIADFQSLVQ